MKEYIFPAENRVIRKYLGAEVSLNIENNCRLEFEFCPANALLYIRRKSYYSDKLAHFEDVDVLVDHLTMPPTVKSRQHVNNAPQTEQTAVKSAEYKAAQQPSPSADNALDFASDDCVEAIVFDDNGNVTERSRSIEGIKRSYNAIRHKVESTANSCYSFFLRPTLDTVILLSRK